MIQICCPIVCIIVTLSLKTHLSQQHQQIAKLPKKTPFQGHKCPSPLLRTPSIPGPSAHTGNNYLTYLAKSMAIPKPSPREPNSPSTDYLTEPFHEFYNTTNTTEFNADSSFTNSKTNTYSINTDSNSNSNSHDSTFSTYISRQLWPCLPINYNWNPPNWRTYLPTSTKT